MSGYMDRNGSDKLHWATYREPAHLARQGKEHAGHRLDPNSADRSDERIYMIYLHDLAYLHDLVFFC
ncbi:Protein CBG18620 [Caenorhabditis briggsae]|uniref:Protein CBG18620 n=1 Tax=Caenorhabditis briggsae TaxID=6238 RepID=A8XTQ7_CAEBR|nr:Protein CBG18620 [Caenorhabditis briggsae]CAP36033.1 Protein CBG18620 [Caenorhabditis briggsae]